MNLDFPKRHYQNPPTNQVIFAAIQHPLVKSKRRFASCLIAPPLLASVVAGCKGNGQPSSTTDSPAIPERVLNLPYDTELSKVTGVSIKQLKPQQFRSSSRFIDTEDLRTAAAENVPLEDLLNEWVDFSGWVFVDADLPERRYDIRVDAPEGTTNFEQIKRAFESVFGLVFTEKTESLEVWVLEKAEKEPRGLELVETKGSDWGTASTPGGFGYEFRAGTMGDLAEILGKYLEGGIVFDETGIEGYYRFVLSMDHWEPKTAAPAVRKLGLRVTRAKRELPVLRINYAEVLKSTSPESSGQ